MKEKPKVEPLKAENLPPVFLKYGKFCCWNYEYNKDRDAWTKIPYDPKTGNRAKSTDPETFTDLATAQVAAKDFSGVGVGIFGNLAGIDIDHCVKENGQLDDMASDIVNIMHSYTEFSPSGAGIRILFTVSPDFDYDTTDTYYIKNSRVGLEIYVAGKTNRFLTLTGNVINQCDLDNRTAELKIILEEFMKRPVKEPAAAESLNPVDLSDSDIIEKALDSNDSKFKALWAGDVSGYPSHSEADQAFCNKLAFWTGPDAGKIDSLFRQSGLMRDKWNRDDYRTRTIKNAVDQCTETYRQGGSTVEQFDESHPDFTENLEKFKNKEQEADEPQSDDIAPRFKAFDVADYITGDGFTQDIEYFKKYKDRKTGFSNIDQYLTLYPGLAFLGGAASLGKTTFCVNLADNLVQRGENVLYFALEQTPIELTTKSLARRLADADPGTPIDNIQIKNGATSDKLEQVKKEYAADVKDKFTIVRCDFTTTAGAICGYIENYIKSTGRRPVVIVDYLQLIAPPDDFRGDIRAATDLAIKTFKTMQLQNELLVIVVSNFNRSGYETPVSYSDFKESGMIEYTADYIWALQLSIVSKSKFTTKQGPKGGQIATTEQEKDKMIDEAINRNPKQVQFVSLKSRNGKQRYTCDFDYYMKYDYFKAANMFVELPGDQRPEFDGLEFN